MARLSNQLEIQKCPHCNIDKPLMSQVTNFGTDRHSGGHARTWKVYSCRSCGGTVTASAPRDNAEITEMFPSGTRETFDLAYLPPEVATDFSEALSCYSMSCHNAFAAMARRTVQSMSEHLGAKGSDRVLGQLKDLKEMAEIDDETFDVLKQIVIGGHDGAHPHLPKLSPERAAVLLELMKDVLYQIYVRKSKIQEAIKLRNQSVEQKG